MAIATFSVGGGRGAQFFFPGNGNRNHTPIDCGLLVIDKQLVILNPLKCISYTLFMVSQHLLGWVNFYLGRKQFFKSSCSLVVLKNKN